MKKENLKPYGLRLSPANITKVKEIAEKEMRSFNQMVNIILGEYKSKTK